MLPITEKNGICFDIETLGTSFDSCIVSIGAVAFNFKDGITSEFSVNIDPRDSKSFGLKIDQKTIAWWMEQPKEVRNSWMRDQLPLKTALNKFNTWALENFDKKSLVYCNGASFDFPIVQTSYRASGEEAFWKYWQEVDMRTIFTILGSRISSFKTDDDMWHDALSDAKQQTLSLIKVLKGEDETD